MMNEHTNINLQEVKDLIDHVEKSKDYNYEMIIEVYNKIFGKTTADCSVCLKMKMMKIKAWYQDQKKKS